MLEQPGILPAYFESDIDGDRSLIPAVSGEEARRWIVTAISSDGRRKQAFPSDTFIGYGTNGPVLNFLAEYEPGVVLEVVRPGEEAVYIYGSRFSPEDPNFSKKWVPAKRTDSGAHRKRPPADR